MQADAVMTGEEILVRNHQHALGLSTITIYGYSHLIDGSLTTWLLYVRDCLTSMGQDSTIHGQYMVTDGLYSVVKIVTCYSAVNTLLKC